MTARHEAAEAAGLAAHAAAQPRHLLEQKTDIRIGHKKLETTALYTGVVLKTIRKVRSPADIFRDPAMAQRAVRTYASSLQLVPQPRGLRF